MKKTSIDERNQKEFLLNERVKELECLYGISELVSKPNISLNEIFEDIIPLISQAWQYPEIIHSRIIFDDGREILCPHGRLPIVEKLSLSSDIKVSGEKIGVITVFYSENGPELDGDVFLNEERSLLAVISERLGQIIEKFEAVKKRDALALLPFLEIFQRPCREKRDALALLLFLEIFQRPCRAKILFSAKT